MPLLHLQNLEKSYRAPTGETVKILDVPEFRLEEGEQVALEGESGSGKTTLLNIIAGILRADAGTVELDGQDMRQLSESRRDRHRARTIGYVFQTFNLLQGYTALENVMLGMLFGAGANRAFAQEILTKLGLEERLGYRPRQLSIGQQQRVALARALANRPKLVLADEPTGNLDHRLAQTAISLIRDLCREQGAALLVVSHDPAILGHFDRVEKLSELNRAARTPEVEA